MNRTSISAIAILARTTSAAATAIVGLWAAPAAADVIEWNNAAGGKFTTAANWDPAVVPGVADDVVFNLDRAYTVLFPTTDSTNLSLLVRDGEVTFDLNSRTYTLTAAQSVEVGSTSGDDAGLTLTGGTLSGVDGVIGGAVGAVGRVTVAAAAWNNSVNLYVGEEGDGALSIEAGGAVTNSVGVIGNFIGSIGSATVTGAGSTWTSTDALYVGGNSDGTLSIADGGQVSNTSGIIGADIGTTGSATINGAGSTWTNTGNLTVGNAGNGTLTIEAGGVVSNGDGSIGNFASSISSATVTGAGSTWTNSGNLEVGETGAGTLLIEDGAQVSNAFGALGAFAGSTGSATVTGADSRWTNSGNLNVGSAGNGTLSIADGGLVSNTVGHIATVSGSTSSATVTGSGSTWNNSDELFVGYFADGTLLVEDDGQVSSASGFIGFHSGSTGSVTVTGAGSTWTNSGFLEVGESGDGTLLVDAGGQVNSGVGVIGNFTGSTGSATVTGAGSTWTNSGVILVGDEGDGTLLVEDGGQVSNINGYIAGSIDSTGSATVTGDGSTWTNDGSLYVGGRSSGSGGAGTLTVGPGGTVYVEETLKLWGPATLNLFGGSLRFDGYDRVAGSTINYAAGAVQLAGDRNVGLDDAITDFFGTSPAISAGKALAVEGAAMLVSPLALDGGTFSAGSLSNAALLDFNTGTLRLTQADLTVGVDGLFGDTLALAADRHVDVANAVVIQSDGRLDLGDGGQLTGGTIANDGVLTGNGRVNGPVLNQGNIEALGTPENPAEIEFTAALTNAAGGDVFLRNAQLHFTGGLINQGTLGVSFGTADLFGAVDNQAGGQAIVSGGSDATFYDDVVNNGELRISDGSTAVFFGDVSGAGDFTGAGTVFFEGSFSPGNSPAIVTADGDVVFGSRSTTQIEIGGLLPGSEHDQLAIAGSASLGGTLEVLLRNGFDPAFGNVFDVLSIGGTRIGAFAGLGEGATFAVDGRRFAISYLGGDGNDVSLTVVPEPTALGLVALAAPLMISGRGRRSASRDKVHRGFHRSSLVTSMA